MGAEIFQREKLYQLEKKKSRYIVDKGNPIDIA